MFRKSLAIISALVLALLATVPAFADRGKPAFDPAIYADGQVWGNNVATALPGSNENNVQSFDKLYVVTNSNNPAGQMPVGEAAPRNRV